MNDGQNVVNNNNQYTSGNFIPNDYQTAVDNSSNNTRKSFFINPAPEDENVQNSEQMNTVTNDYSNISMGQYVQTDTTNYQVNQVGNQQTEMMQVMPTVQQNMMGYQTMDSQVPMQQNAMYQQQTNAYQTQMPVTQTDMGMATYQNTNLTQTQAMSVVGQDTNVYQNNNMMQQNSVGYTQPQVASVPYPTPGIQPNNVYQSPNLPQPMVSNQAPVAQNIYQIDTSAQTMGMQQQIPQQNMMYQQQQVTPNSYPALGSINNPYQNNNMMQTNFQTGQTAYQNTGATQIGRMNTYQTRMNKPSSSYTPEKKKFKFGNFLLLLIFIAVVAFGIYYFFLQGNGSYTGFANLKAIYDPNKLIRVHSDGLAGYIKTNGDVVVSPQYQRSTDFYGGYAAVKMPDEDNYKVIDEKGEVVFQLETSAHPEYLLDYDIWILDNCIYNNKMEKVVSNVRDERMGLFSFVDEANSKVGIVDHKGEVLYETTGTEIEIDYNYLSEDDVYFIVYVSGSPDVIIRKNTKKVVYTAPEGSSIESEGDSIYLVETADAEKYLYVEDGKVLHEFTDAFYVRMHNVEKKILKIARLYPLDDYYFDVTSGVQVAEVEQVSSYDLEEEVNGYKEISCETDDNYEGLMKDDEIILECKYDAVAFLEEKLFSYIKNRRFREYVLLREDEKVILYDLVFKKEVYSIDGVDRVGGGEDTIFLFLYADDDSDNTKDVVYNLMSGKTMEFSAGEYMFLAGTNYFAAYNGESNTAEYYNSKMKNIYSSSNYISM